MVVDNIRIVLVHPTHPGNVGAAARAMKNMSLQRLYLVAPRKFPSPEANDRAAGADDLLQNAVVCASLDEAIKDCHLVIGTTARQRRIEWPALDPVAGANRLVESARHGAVALLFGRERTGLLNDELDRCQWVLSIPANKDFSSLNLASAVQIMAYEIHRAMMSISAPGVAGSDEDVVNSEDRRLFYRHLEQVLCQIGFLDPQNPRLLMRRLRRLFNRLSMDHNEMNILRGILTAVQQKCSKID